MKTLPSRYSRWSGCWSEISHPFHLFRSLTLQEMCHFVTYIPWQWVRTPLSYPFYDVFYENYLVAKKCMCKKFHTTSNDICYVIEAFSISQRLIYKYHQSMIECVRHKVIYWFLNIVVHVGRVGTYTFLFSLFSQHISSHCLCFTADVIKCGALFYICLITTKKKQNMQPWVWTYDLTLTVGCSIPHPKLTLAKVARNTKTHDGQLVIWDL
jgi:hypothetical protein